MKKVCLALVACFLLAVLPGWRFGAPGTTYYVSPNGNDANSGTTPDAPWATIAKVNGFTNFQPNDSVLFQGGGSWTGCLLFNRTTNPNNGPFKIGAYSSPSNFQITSNCNAARAAAIEIKDLNNVTLQSCTLIGGTSGGNLITQYGALLHAVSFGANNNTIQGCDISGFGTPSGAETGGEIFLLGATGKGIDSSRILNNTLHGNAGITSPDDAGIGGKSSGIPYNITNTLAQGNLIYNIGGTKGRGSGAVGNGIVLNQSSNFVAQYNVVHDYGANTNSCGGPAAIWNASSDHWTIQYNEAYNARPVLADFDGTISGTTLTVTNVRNGTITINSRLDANGTVTRGTRITAPGTGTGGTGTYTIDTSQTVASTTAMVTMPIAATLNGTISGTTLTVNSISAGGIYVGMNLLGSGVTAASHVTGYGTGLGGTGTYTVDNSQTVGPVAMAGNPGCDWSAFDFDIYANNSVMQYNYAHDIVGAGCVFWTSGVAGGNFSGNLTCRYNVFENVGNLTSILTGPYACLYLAGSSTGSGQYVYNNTCVSTYGETNQAALKIDKGNVYTNCLLGNNILQANTTSYIVYAIVVPDPTCLTLNNDYFLTAGTTNFKWGNTGGSGGGVFVGLAQWQTGSGPVDTLGLTVSPLLVSAGNGGTCNSSVGSSGPQPCPSAYKLTHSSTLMGAGLDLTQAPYSLAVGSRDYYADTIPIGVGSGYNVGADGAAR